MGVFLGSGPTWLIILEDKQLDVKSLRWAPSVDLGNSPLNTTWERTRKANSISLGPLNQKLCIS